METLEWDDKYHLILNLMCLYYSSLSLNFGRYVLCNGNIYDDAIKASIEACDKINDEPDKHITKYLLELLLDCSPIERAFIFFIKSKGLLKFGEDALDDISIWFKLQEEQYKEEFNEFYKVFIEDKNKENK